MAVPEIPQEVETYKPEPDTIRVSKSQESPAKRCVFIVPRRQI